MAGGVLYTTAIEVYDIETGEQITKQHVIKGHYIIQSKNIKYENHGNIRKKIIQWFCRTNNQQRIEFK